MNWIKHILEREVATAFGQAPEESRARGRHEQPSEEHNGKGAKHRRLDLEQLKCSVGNSLGPEEHAQTGWRDNAGNGSMINMA